MSPTSPTEARVAPWSGGASSHDLDALIERILDRTKTIAVLGMKDAPDEDAYRIPAYMADHGYVVVPVNPKLDTALGARAYADLEAVSDAGVPVDLVNVFRASENVEGHVDEILAMERRPTAVWLQLGIHHGPSARRLREAGIDVVQDRCLMVDHRRLSERSGERAAGA
jgi:hypothetical protein